MKKVHEFFAEDPSRWTQGLLAKDVYGYSVDIDSASAVKWCLEGAIIKYYPFGEVLNAITRLSEVLGPHDITANIIAWQDAQGRTVEEVIAMAKEADV